MSGVAGGAWIVPSIWVPRVNAGTGASSPGAAVRIGSITERFTTEPVWYWMAAFACRTPTAP